MPKEKTVLVELGFSADERTVMIKLTCDEPMDDEDVYLSLEDFLLTNAFFVKEDDGGLLH